MSLAFKTIALAKEIESPENPGGLERRVALIPDDVASLTRAGVRMLVEEGAGLAMDFSDEDYVKAGAEIQTKDEIYGDKDMIIKFKNVALTSIAQMRPGCTLFCMAHFSSYPDRAVMLEEQQINVVAMEEVLQSPKRESDVNVMGRLAMKSILERYPTEKLSQLNIIVFQWTQRLWAAIHRAGNRNPNSLRVVHDDVSLNELGDITENSLLFYDAKTFPKHQQDLLSEFQKLGGTIFDLQSYEKHDAEQAIKAYRDSHVPFDFGGRRIQCLHETGQAGARYGVKLVTEAKQKNMAELNAVVLGYGNVAQGAIDELYQQGVHKIHVLGRTHTSAVQIEKWINNADLIINGAEQAQELRGKNYLITNQHLKENLNKGTVIIDLVGGSKTNRSPIEPVISCTFLTEPHFIQDDVIVSALWGWPMLGMELESTVRYSKQIVDVLLGKERLLDGIDKKDKWLEHALVCGPY